MFPFGCNPLFTRAPSQVHGVHKYLQKKLANELEGSYVPGHLIVVDPDIRNPDNSKEIRYEGQLTYVKASARNTSVELAEVTVSGQQKAQEIVPPVCTPTYFDETYLHPNPIVGSDQYMVNHKANHIMSLPQEENT